MIPSSFFSLKKILMEGFEISVLLSELDLNP